MTQPEMTPTPLEAIEYFAIFAEWMPRRYREALAVLRKAVQDNEQHSYLMGLAVDEHERQTAQVAELEAERDALQADLAATQTRFEASATLAAERGCEISELEEQVKQAREALIKTHDCATTDIHGKCDGCIVSETLAKLAPAEQEKG
jgi:hypothetical protein